ncbi:C4-dicarboxylate ABC transporter substrate-binding protein [Caldovatus sediminis]|uniref:C4-dicarboxylate ABC transporter substrate-binding protein n=1 Tax=Caldovatus sediminis TaxID=2041189 RepID=A0A8J2Z8X6_9PROT|nr:TAXI family TRAP transporter solute-binding subunit [Caldovatus sediminis]GGG21885.1 C4-dicarboxylate ABC transporter substrate-binding protein [Caldovatus sediminis]
MNCITRRTFGMGVAAAALGTAPAAAQRGRSYVLTTATTGGTYYPVGVAIATLIKVRLQAQKNIDMSAISSAGSTENVKLLRENQAQFAILQGLVAQFAATGTGAFANDGAQANLRGIMPLWYNYEQFVIDKRLVTTGRIGDLKNLYGRKYSMGARGSGLETMHRWIFPNLGIEYEKFDLVYLGYGPTAEALQNGTIQGGNFEAGLPTGSLTQAMAAAGDRLQILEFTEEDVAKANGNTTLLSQATIPANTYPNQPNALRTARLPNYLAVNAAVPEEDVYLVTKTIFENLPFLNNIHGATREIDLRQSLGGYPFPLHPGAIRYYREAGMDVPAALIPA